MIEGKQSDSKIQNPFNIIEEDTRHLEFIKKSQTLIFNLITAQKWSTDGKQYFRFVKHLHL